MNDVPYNYLKRLAKQLALIDPLYSTLRQQLSLTTDISNELHQVACKHEIIRELRAAFEHLREFETYYEKACKLTDDAIEGRVEDNTPTGDDGLIADCIKKLKAGLAGLEPGGSYTLTVAKEADVPMADISPEDFAKRFKDSYQVR